MPGHPAAQFHDESGHRHPAKRGEPHYDVDTRYRAELVTEDVAAPKTQLEAVTGERVSALEGSGAAVKPERENDGKALAGVDVPGRETHVPALPEPDMEPVRIPANGAGSRAAHRGEVVGVGTGTLNAAGAGVFSASYPRLR